MRRRGRQQIIVKQILQKIFIDVRVYVRYNKYDI